jgi:LPS-assembly protein
VLVALLALALAATPTAPAPDASAPPLEVLEAEQVDYDMAAGRGVATGHVFLRRGAVTLRAQVATYDTRTGEVDATGGVVLAEPGRAVTAERMHVLLDGPYVAHDVVAFLKDAPLDLSRCRTLDEARTTGRNRAVMGGVELRGESGVKRFEVDSARITLCDCGGGPPSWEIRSRHADIIPGERALMSWPVIYVTPRLPFVHGTLDIPVLRRIVNQPVPVLILPAIYLPLSDRQTGLLLPEIAYGGSGGFGISQPLFITLGRSWDATVTADYTFAPSGARPSDRVVIGPGTKLELRWAPAEGTRGDLRLSFLHDLREVWPSGVALPPGWNRYELSLAHEERLSDRTFLAASLDVFGDPLYVLDLTSDALLKAQEYRRSAVALTHRTSDVALGAEAGYLLPLAHLDGGAALRAPFGTFGADLSTFHRLPAVSLTLLPVRVGGPLRLAAEVGVARFGPLRGTTGDEGVDGVGEGGRRWGAEGAVPDAGERDGRWQGPGAAGPGERLAATRLSARVELRAPLAWRALELEPWLTGTAASYAFEAGPGAQLAARGTGGLALSTQIGRSFGDGAGRLRHEIEPRLEWRGGTGEVGAALPNYAYDELDVALPARVLDASGKVTLQRTLTATPGRFSQLRLTVRNRLIAPAGPLSTGRLDLTLGQDLDAAAGRASETWAQASVRLPYVVADARAGVRAFGASASAETPRNAPASVLDAYTELAAGLTLLDGRGDNLHASFLALGAGASPRAVAGLEPLFDSRPVAADAVASGSVGAGAHFSGATVAYDALFYGRKLPAPPVCGNGTTKSAEPHIYQHQASLIWDSPCHCWRAGFTAVLNECDAFPAFHFVVDLSALAGGALPH